MACSPDVQDSTAICLPDTRAKLTEGAPCLTGVDRAPLGTCERGLSTGVSPVRAWLIFGTNIKRRF